jgi:tetratricopeptide (TPR) repeat protein
MNDSGSDETIFEAARQIAKPTERAAYLEEKCLGDVDLRRRVEELLQANEAAMTFLEEPGGAAAPDRKKPRPTVKVSFTNVATPGEGPGMRIGRYKLLQQIGEGGCGTVFMAEQEEPVRRRVALKLIKLGMDTRQVVARFEAERQALAMMDHPNIAKVFDAGVTDSGRPYFVMELVRGIPITRYCDEQRLDTEARLRIFMDVCAGVQHAHQKGIIHRDIKPSNILVTQRGDKAWPMVIDFGIAKATQGRLTDRTLFTAFEQFIGTPAYMSPEQAGLSGLDIDTRSDIYSLGVLLYELLTGSPPFNPKTLNNAGLEEIRRIIREDEPPRPSTRLSTLTAEDLTTMARNHSANPRRVAVMLRGDLDWVVMKALEKDRDRRYESANVFAADLERFLRHEAVSAVAPSATYKLQKFVRRNRRGVAAALVIAALLVVGITATTWLAVIATRAKNQAAREAVRSAEVAQFLKEMLEGVGPARARGRDTAMLREILDNAARRVGTDLTNQPAVEIELSTTIGRTYRAIGSLSDAEKLNAAAYYRALRVFGPSHTNVVITMEELGWTLRELGRFAEATNVFAQAITLSRNLVGEDTALTAGPMHRLGSVYADLGQFAEAERLLLRSGDILRRKLGPGNLQTLHARQNLAALYFRQQKLTELEPVIMSALADARISLGDENPLTQTMKVLLALLRQDQGRFEEAEKLHTEVLASKRHILGDAHPNTLASMDNLAVVYGYQGRFAEAEVLTRTALSLYAKLGISPNRDVAAIQVNHAEYLRNLGRHAEAEAEFQRVIATDSSTMPENDPFLLEARNSLAVLLALRGRWVEAETLGRDIVRIRRANLPADDLTLAESVVHLAGILFAEGKTTEAEPLAREAIAVLDAQRPDGWRRFAAWSLVGGCRLAVNDTAAAESLLRLGYDGLKAREARIPAIDQSCLREALQRLESFSMKQAQPTETARWREQLEQFDRSPAGQRLHIAKGGAPAP